MKLLRIFLLSPLLALTGCVNLGLDAGKDATEIVYYVMEDGARATAAAVTPAARVLVLTDTQAGAFYDTDGMAFSRQPGTRGYYQFARWSERSGKRFSDLLLARLEREKLFAAVAQTSSNVRGDWLLTTEIVEFYHDASQPPGAVKMELRAEVVDLKTRSLVARRMFSQTIASSSFDAAGAHKAFNEASTRTLNEMADWLKGLSARN
jgi:cholesterol transport system auxiliary component